MVAKSSISPETHVIRSVGNATSIVSQMVWARMCSRISGAQSMSHLSLLGSKTPHTMTPCYRVKEQAWHAPCSLVVVRSLLLVVCSLSPTDSKHSHPPREPTVTKETRKSHENWLAALLATASTASKKLARWEPSHRQKHGAYRIHRHLRVKYLPQVVWESDQGLGSTDVDKRLLYNRFGSCSTLL